MNLNNHTNEACIPCKYYDKGTDYVKEAVGCSNVSDNHITMCIDGFYIKDGECRLCPLCNADNHQPECCKVQTSTAPPVAGTTSTPFNLNVTGSGMTAISSTGILSTANQSNGFNPTDSTNFKIIIPCVSVVVVVILVVVIIYLYRKPAHDAKVKVLIKPEKESTDSVQQSSSSDKLV